MREKESKVPIQYIQMPLQNCYEEDEIDLKELIKTILKYKKFMAIFTILVTFLAGVYAFLKTPIYEVKAILTPGYINVLTDNGYERNYFYTPEYLVNYIKSNFDNSKNRENPFPVVDASVMKNSKEIVELKVQNISNKKALNDLNAILKDINSKESKKIEVYKKNISKEISILKEEISSFEKELKNLKEKLSSIKDPNLLGVFLSYNQKLKQKIFENKKRIASLENRLSPLFINKSKIIGKIDIKDYPTKPKKKLIISVAFITGLILSIFLIFFIEFIKGFKEEKE